MHILKAVLMAVQKTNEILPLESKLEGRESERIIGVGAKLDSLGFVTLIVAVEQEVETVAGSCPGLMEYLTDPSAGITTLGQLIDYIASICVTPAR
jgi:hypothetical protein